MKVTLSQVFGRPNALFEFDPKDEMANACGHNKDDFKREFEQLEQAYHLYLYSTRRAIDEFGSIAGFVRESTDVEQLELVEEASQQGVVIEQQYHVWKQAAKAIHGLDA